MYRKANFNRKSVLQLGLPVRIQNCQAVRLPVGVRGFPQAEWTK